MKGSQVPVVAVTAFVVTAVVITTSATLSQRPPVPPPDIETLPGLPTFGQIRFRSAAKELLAREVAAGQRSLIEAAALFDRLNTLGSYTATDHQIIMSADCEGLAEGDEATTSEAICLQVMLWAISQTEPNSPARKVLQARLKEEYHTARQQGVTTQLPVPSDAAYQAVLARASAELNLQSRGSRVSDSALPQKKANSRTGS